MQYKLLTLAYSPTLGGFDGRPLEEFSRTHQVVSCREQFFRHDGVPHLLCLLAYQPAPVGATPTVEEPRKEKLDPARDLTEEERALYQRLREWRNDRARAEGVPGYIVLTNRQLAEVVRRQPDSKTALAGVPGIGEAKIKQHGEAILAQLALVRENGKPARDES